MTGNEGGAYHDQRALHTKDWITREPLITLRINGGNQFPITGGLDRNMEVIWSHVMTIEVNEELSDRSLITAPDRYRWSKMRVGSPYITWDRICHGHNSPVSVATLLVTPQSSSAIGSGPI